jgi:hypothetical protein
MLVVKLLVTEKQDWEYFRQIVVSLYIETPKKKLISVETMETNLSQRKN